MRALMCALFPGIDDAPNPTLYAFSEIDRSVRSSRHAVCAIRRLRRRLRCLRTGETIGEHLELTRRLAAGKRLERHVVAVLHGRCSIPRSVERDERAATIPRRK